MIRYLQGDLLADDAEALVNTVNCVGVMGRGIALQFRRNFPDNFRAYEAACKRGEVVPGRMFVYATGRLSPPRFIVNFPTKRHWRGDSLPEDIEAGLAALKAEIRSRVIRSIAIPPLGSGLGGLDWTEVRPLVDAALASLPNVEIRVYEPRRSSAVLAAPRFPPKMTPGRAALISLVYRYLSGLLDTSISLLEIHKLLYFMQEAGEALRLRIVKAEYGPYADNLRHVMQAIEGSFTAGYGDGGDNPDKPIDLLPGAVAAASEVLAHHPATKARQDRVSALVDGFESPFGLELLATVHWVATREGASSPASLVDATYAWNPRKRQFSSDQIRLAADTLRTQNWLPAPSS